MLHFDTYYKAHQYAKAHNMRAVKVYGGYLVMSWQDYYIWLKQK